MLVAAIAVAGLGWYLFIYNTLTAPSRGSDLYDTAIAVGVIFEAVPAIAVSSLLAFFGVRAWRSHERRWPAAKLAAGAFILQMIVLVIVASALSATGTVVN
jgi:hypothetical protein